METKKAQKTFSLQNSPNLGPKNSINPNIKSNNRRTTGFLIKRLSSFLNLNFKAINSGIKILNETTLLAKRKTLIKKGLLI